MFEGVCGRDCRVFVGCVCVCGVLYWCFVLLFLINVFQKVSSKVYVFKGVYFQRGVLKSVLQEGVLQGVL